MAAEHRGELPDGGVDQVGSISLGWQAAAKVRRMDPRDHQRTAGQRMAGPLEALAQRVTEGVVSLLVQSVDLNGIVRHVDLDAVLDRINIDRLLQRIDVNALLARVDLDAFLARVDLDALIERMDLPAVIARSSAEVASETMDEVRGEARRLDDSADRWAGHVFHHKHTSQAEPPPAGAPPQGNVPASEDTGQR